VEDALPKAVNELEHNKDIGSVGVRLDDIVKKTGSIGQKADVKEPGIQHLGIEFRWSEKRSYYQPEQIRHSSRKQYLTEQGNQSGNPKNASFLPAVTAAFMLVRKVDFKMLNGFSEEYVYGLEDIDFCLRLGRDLKKKCWCINEVGLQHVDGATRFKADNRFRSADIDKNHAVFKRKWSKYIQDNYIHGKQLTTPNNNFLNILFVLPGPAESNNGYHVQLLARTLQAQGVNCTIAVPDLNQSDGQQVKTNVFSASSSLIISYSQLIEKASSFSFNLIHAWTPREIVREFTEMIIAKHNCRLIIHLEDNEEYLTETTVGRSFNKLSRMPQAELDKIIPKNRFHPIKGRNFLDKAQGLTMVIKTLNRYNYTKVPYQIIPMVDERLFYPRPINRKLRMVHDITDDTTVLVYNGNVHTGNSHEVEELYKAINLLKEQGRSVVLLRSGKDIKNLGAEAQAGKKSEINLGWVERHELPEILAAADIFVQPGKTGPFNDDRIPCKLPEYFAMGRPVILPRTNLGLKIRHEREGYVLENADAKSIAGAVWKLCSDKHKAEIMAMHGFGFSRSFTITQNIEKIYAFYNLIN